MKTKKIKLSELTPDPQNTRSHDERNIGVVKESLEKFGQYRPFVVQEKGMIIRVGNGMYQAMQELGWTEGDAVVKDLTDEEATALSILDNKSSELAEWDDELLAEIFDDLPEDLFKLTGFSEEEINKYLTKTELTETINSATEYIEKYDKAEKREDRIKDKIEKLKQKNPEAMLNANMIIIDGNKGNEALLIVDDNFADFVTEIKRYVGAGISSPLEAILQEVHKL